VENQPRTTPADVLNIKVVTMQSLIAHLPRFTRIARPKPAQLLTSPSGTSAFLAFPRFPELGEAEALNALDSWLGDHPTCSVVLLNELPTGRTLRRVQKICGRHGCAYMVRAARRAAVAQ
jgi:hypothetical protein